MSSYRVGDVEGGANRGADGSVCFRVRRIDTIYTGGCDTIAIRGETVECVLGLVEFFEVKMREYRGPGFRQGLGGGFEAGAVLGFLSEVEVACD